MSGVPAKILEMAISAVAPVAGVKLTGMGMGMGMGITKTECLPCRQSDSP
jgi:hypothetical protein